MTPNSRRQFESAEEVFQVFVPDFHPTHAKRRPASEFLLGKRGGADLARKVLEEFKGTMMRGGVRSKSVSKR